MNLHGNPFCKQDDYQRYAIAHLPFLVYLDYRLIDGAKRNEAIDSFRDAIDELVHDEAILKRKKIEEEQKAAERIVHKVFKKSEV